MIMCLPDVLKNIPAARRGSIVQIEAFMKKGENNMRLHWEFVNESLNGEEQTIVAGHYGKRMRLKDGLYCFWGRNRKSCRVDRF